MNTEIDELMFSKPYFAEKKETETEMRYYFFYEKERYYIGVHKKPDLENHFYFTYLDFDREGGIEDYWEFPFFLREIEVKTNEICLKKERLRILFRKPQGLLANKLFYTLLLRENLQAFWDSIYFMIDEDYHHVHPGVLEEIELRKDIFDEAGIDYKIKEMEDKKQIKFFWKEKAQS